eukprot:m.341296 g.341296  ORF g.341296 m.341296 type:complete len:285 (+) comp19986_c0_seq1:101-955(+)
MFAVESPKLVTKDQWDHFDKEGYVVLEEEQVLTSENTDLLLQRIDDIMLGKAELDYNKLMMQLDSETGRYEDIGEQSLGHKGSTLGYRKIQNLEHDDLFAAYLKHPVFEDACHRMYGLQNDISAFRVMFFNKPAGKGTNLPWHQDRWQHLDKDPLLTVYTALDPAGLINGCVQVIPKSHKKGVINREHHSSFLTEGQINDHCPASEIVNLELKKGQVALLHNWTIHRSGVNNSKDMARRAFSVNYMHGDTRIVKEDVYKQNLEESKSTGYAEGSDYFPIIFTSK